MSAEPLVDALEQCRDYLRHLSTGSRMPGVEDELRRVVDRALGGPDPWAAAHRRIAERLSRPAGGSE